MHAVQFIDPAGVLTTYTWPRGPDPAGVTPAQKARQITRTSNTANIGATRQQGDDGAYVISWTIAIRNNSTFETALWKWFRLCGLQSIYLIDMRGAEYEGQITALSLQEDGEVPSGLARYTFEFEVWTFRSGVIYDAGVLA